MRLCRVLAVVSLGTLAALCALAWRRPVLASERWNVSAAAGHMDARQAEWERWPRTAKDHGTVCVSCHTQVPYALARPILRKELGETVQPEAEQAMLRSVRTRVDGWDIMEPFYNDAKSGAGKTVEAYSMEPVLNAFILASYGASDGSWSSTEQKAFAEMWAKQIPDGPNAGGWVWLNFHNAPWEGETSAYYGAALAMIALDMAPRQYREDAAIQTSSARLRYHLRDHYEAQPLANKLMLLWAAGKDDRLLTAAQCAALLGAIAAKQNADGGWSLPQMSEWKRHDGTAIPAGSDGVATGLVLVALHAAGVPARNAEVAKGLQWLVANQNPRTGTWPGYSVNHEIDPAQPGAQFMTDAATGFASLALVEYGR
jgi:squalene-hopene/tetraprenyl-beta-curcumene cyclase